MGEIEKSMINRFVESKKLEGYIHKEYMIGNPEKVFGVETNNEEEKAYLNIAKKRIDLVVDSPMELWILEFRPKLCESLLGKLLIDKKLLKESDIPPTWENKCWKLGACFEQTDKMLEKIFKSYKIELFKV